MMDNGSDIAIPDINARKLVLLAAVYLDIAELNPIIHTEKAIPHNGMISCSMPIP